MSGNASTASTATTSSNIVTTVTTGTAVYPTFVTLPTASASTGALIDAGISYNASTNNLSTTTFTGALSGNATSATTATTAGTVTTAAQPNITSIGSAANTLSLLNSVLMINSSFFPIINTVISNETTVLTTAVTITLRAPIAFRLSTSKLPVFSLTTAANGTITLDIHKNGTTIFGTKPTIVSTATASTGGTLTTSPTTFVEGDFIRAYVFSTTDTAATGLKVTIYNS